VEDQTSGPDPSPAATRGRVRATPTLGGEWSLDEPLALGPRGLEDVLVRRERTALTCDGLRFDFLVDASERSEAGQIREVRLRLREEAAGAIDLEVVVRPRIQAVTIEKLGPLDLPTLRAAARKLLRSAAAQVAARR
jgi:hypothetical protein